MFTPFNPETSQSRGQVGRGTKGGRWERWGGGCRSCACRAEVGETVSFRSLSIPHRCGPACGWGGGRPQGHFRSTHCFPPSSYSCLEIHICWKVPWVGGAGGRSGRPRREGEQDPHTPPVEVRNFPPPSPHSPCNHQLAPSPCPLLRIQRADTRFIPFNHRCIH